MLNKRPQNPMGALWHTIQSWLLPVLEDDLGELDEKHQLFVAVPTRGFARAPMLYSMADNVYDCAVRQHEVRFFFALIVWNRGMDVLALPQLLASWCVDCKIKCRRACLLI